MARKPKKSPQGFSAEDLTKFLLGDESLDLLRKAKNLEAQNVVGQGTMAQQFGVASIPPQARRLMGQIALGSEGVLKSNVADVLGARDAFLALDKQSPTNALYALASVLPLGGAGKMAKMSKNTLKSILNTLRSGDRNPRLETGSRLVPLTDTSSRAAVDAWIMGMLQQYR